MSSSTPSWLAESRDALTRSHASLKSTGEFIDRLGSKLAAFGKVIEDAKSPKKKDEHEEAPKHFKHERKRNLDDLSMGPLSQIASLLDVRQTLRLANVCSSLRDAVLAGGSCGLSWNAEAKHILGTPFYSRARLLEGEATRAAILELLNFSFGSIANWPLLFIEAYDAIKNRNPFSNRTQTVLRAFIRCRFERIEEVTCPRTNALILSLLLQITADPADHRTKAFMADDGAVRRMVVATRAQSSSLNLHLHVGILANLLVPSGDGSRHDASIRTVFEKQGMLPFSRLLCSPAYFFHSMETFHVARLMLNFVNCQTASPALNWPRERIFMVEQNLQCLSSKISGFLPHHRVIFDALGLGIIEDEGREGKENDIAWHLQLFTQSLASSTDIVGCRLHFNPPNTGSRRGALVGEGFHDDYGPLTFLGWWALAPRSSQSGGMKATIFGLQEKALDEVASSSFTEESPLFQRLTPGVEKVASQFLRRLAHLEMALVWSAGPCGIQTAAAFGKEAGSVQEGSLFGVWSPWVAQSYSSPLSELHCTGGVMRAVPVQTQT